MSRPHCSTCGRWDGTHSTGCTGLYIGKETGCSLHARHDYQCGMCRTNADMVNREQARALRADADSAGLEELGAAAAIVEREIDASLDSLQPGEYRAMAMDLAADLPDDPERGRYDVDRENYLLGAIADCSARDADILGAVFNAGGREISGELMVRWAALLHALDGRIDELVEEIR